MERISIFNYEAFYLDFLEGNLSEEDTALLMAFLEEHPELKVDEDDFLSLDAPTMELSHSDKKELKQIDENAAIVLSNVEHFMIADAEGILSGSKRKELDGFIAKHPQLEQERVAWKAMYLVANRDEVYGDNSDLKRRTIVFWPYAAAVAACIVVAFLLLNNSNSGTPAEGSAIADDTEKVKQKRPKEESNESFRYQVEEDAPETIPTAYQNQSPRKKVTPEYKEPGNQPAPNILPEDERIIAKLPELKRRDARLVPTSFDGSELEPVTGQIIAQSTEQNMNQSDVSQLGFGDMKDPIKPITSRIRRGMKKPFDFRTSKATKTKKGGFYLKIGKFEILRKRKKR